MKNNKLFLKIYLSLLIIFIITLIILTVLGNKTRIGYLTEFKFDEYHINKTLELNNFDTEETKKLFIINGELDNKALTNYIFTNELITNYSYGFRLKYYSKIFRNSDIYGVYPDINKFIKENSFIKEMKMDDNGSPFGNLISSIKIDSNKIDNIDYKLKIKLINIMLIVFIIFFTYYIFVVFTITFNNNKLYYITIFIILIFSIFVRIFWAIQQDALHWDEVYSILAANNNFDYINFEKKLDNTKGEYILKNMFFNDKSIKDAVSDIKSLYFDSKDKYISNLYYILLRLSFAGREAYSYKNIILTGTILNCLFWIITYFFIYKILKLVFKNNDRNLVILFLLISSIHSYSITISMFLRPYQLQETFFVVILYFIINTIYYSLYSKYNFILTTIITGIGYLTLSSSILYILIISFCLFILSLRNCSKNSAAIFGNITKKTLIYYASAFFSAFLISLIIYPKFLSIFISQGYRSSRSLKGIENLFSYINNYTFYKLLPYMLLTLLILIALKIDKKNIKFFIKIKNISILIFIVIIGILFSVTANILAPYPGARYSGASYILILFLIPIIISIFYNKNLRLIILMPLIILYLYNITTPKNFENFEQRSELMVLKENLPVYMYDTFFSTWEYNYINTNLYYSYIKNENELKEKIIVDKYYFIVRDNELYILTNSFFNLSKVEKIIRYKNYGVFVKSRINIFKINSGNNSNL